MDTTIKLPNQLYEHLARKSRLLERTPDELVTTLVESYLNESNEQWQENFQELLAHVQAKTSAYPSNEIEADITIAADEARELRRGRRS